MAAHSLNRRLWIFETTLADLLNVVGKETVQLAVGLGMPEPAGLGDGELRIIGDV